MVDVDVDVEHARVVLQELEDGEDDVIDVAEALGAVDARVVQAAAPVDGDLGEAVVERDGRADGHGGGALGKIKDRLEDWAVVLHRASHGVALTPCHGAKQHLVITSMLPPWQINEHHRAEYGVRERERAMMPQLSSSEASGCDSALPSRTTCSSEFHCSALRLRLRKL